MCLLYYRASRCRCFGNIVFIHGNRILNLSRSNIEFVQIHNVFFFVFYNIDSWKTEYLQIHNVYFYVIGRVGADVVEIEYSCM